MKKERWLWPLCKDCALPYCTLGEFRDKNPFTSVPENRKCSNILKTEKEMWKRKSQEVANGCQGCNWDCVGARVKSGNGADFCVKKNTAKNKGQNVDKGCTVQKVLTLETTH